MRHLGLIVKDNHQKTVEMLVDYGHKHLTEVRETHLHIIDNKSRYPYRSYFFENLPWAAITVHRTSELDIEMALSYLFHKYMQDGDTILVTKDCVIFFEWTWQN